MKKLITLLSLFALYQCAGPLHAQTLPKNVQKVASTNAITEELVIPTGRTLSASGSGAIIATALDGAYPGQASIVTVGTITTGTWHGGVMGAAYGGTGVANTGTITLGGNFTTSGAFTTTLTVTGNTTVTLPTTGTLAVTASPVFTTQITTPKIVYTGSVIELSGTGTPEAAVTAAIGSVFHRTDGSSATTLYVKESGSGNTGWTAMGGGGGSGTINSGTANQLTYYAGTGTTVSGLTSANNSILVTNGSGVPAWGTTLPAFTSGTITMGTSGGTISGSSGSIAIAAAGSNQNVTINPTGTGQIAIGTPSTDVSSGYFAVYGTSDTTSAVTVRRASADVSGGFLLGSKARGTMASPTAVSSGDNLFTFYAGGYTGSTWNEYGTRFGVQASQTWTGSNQGSQFIWSVTPNNSTTRGDKMLLTNAGSLVVNSVTDDGTNTLQVNGSIKAATTIATAAPSGASAGVWKLGTLVTGLTLTTNLTQAVYVDIGGVVYKLMTGS